MKHALIFTLIFIQLINAKLSPFLQDFMYYRTDSKNYVEKYISDLNSYKLKEVEGVTIVGAGLVKLYSSLSIKDKTKITKGVFTSTRAEACNYNAGKLFKFTIKSGESAIVLNPSNILAIMKKYESIDEIGGNIKRNYYGQLEILNQNKEKTTWCKARESSKDELVHPSRSEIDRPILSKICSDFGVKTIWANWQDFFETYICNNDDVEIEESTCVSSVLKVPTGVVNCY